ncbi:MAG: AAA family ATPase, partial [Calditrichia bacterium]
MIKYLKCSNHKAIKEVFLNNLGKINILCGKNNSGKTSIFEALVNDKNYGLGKRIEDVEWMTDLLEGEFGRYSNPSPHSAKEWFRSFISGENT